MILVEIGSMMMLPTRHTTSTRMLSVLANAAVTSGDMAATGRKSISAMRGHWDFPRTYCLRVLVSRVGIVLAE